MKSRNKSQTFRLTILGVLTAIVVIQTFIPFLGYIPIGPLSLTIIPITVILTAIVFGPKNGAIVGGVWGMITFIRAFVAPTSPLAPIIFTNPLISVLPRILIGITAGSTYYFLEKSIISNARAMRIAALIGSLTNTFLVLGLTYIFYKVPYANAYNIDVTEVLPTILYILVTNGIAEAILSFIIAPIVAKPLLKFMKTSS
ncbi:ECF transporter S component [Calidifontibacillus oryziterrae]|uniref:ECF transporter S component n=1 Tax=Calidifontibacillus oryziterrae TaxID=1191699 RepID=UPI0002E94193|nr:ECF transporter S component [Calidifontibacillus oryziterrae]